MIKELQDIRDAIDPDEGKGFDPDTARRLADEYIAAHPAEFDEYRTMSVPQLVHAIDVLRDAGLEDQHWRIEAWLLHRFEPQNIGGVAEPQVRITLADLAAESGTENGA